MREIKKQLPGNADEYRMLKPVPSRSRLSAGQELVSDKLTY